MSWSIVNSRSLKKSITLFRKPYKAKEMAQQVNGFARESLATRALSLDAHKKLDSVICIPMEKREAEVGAAKGH